MYRRYIVVGVVFFILIGAYFVFFNDKKGSNDYEKYYNKLVEREEFVTYLDDVNISVEEIDEGASKFSYIITFDGVTENQNNVKILVLDSDCSKEKIEEFPSFGIIENKGYSLVKMGDEDIENRKLKGVNLTVLDEEEIDYFIIYFSSDKQEKFIKIQVGEN